MYNTEMMGARMASVLSSVGRAGLPLGHTYMGLFFGLLAQAGVGDGRLHLSRARQVHNRSWRITELLVHSGILGYVRGGGGVEHQPDEDSEERQEVKSWKLEHNRKGI